MSKLVELFPKYMGPTLEERVERAIEDHKLVKVQVIMAQIALAHLEKRLKAQTRLRDQLVLKMSKLKEGK